MSIMDCCMPRRRRALRVHVGEQKDVTLFCVTATTDASHSHSDDSCALMFVMNVLVRAALVVGSSIKVAIDAYATMGAMF